MHATEGFKVGMEALNQGGGGLLGGLQALGLHWFGV